ncbi:MAG: hypothetical protein DLM61_09460 [Pseudonocardiales bacterium]|nr:MAG: hypothetical protein DLM61_09460 [Pseudonocardiales bacterium]
MFLVYVHPEASPDTLRALSADEPGRVPASAWGAVLDGQGQPRDPGEAGVIELTALLRDGPGGD